MASSERVHKLSVEAFSRLKNDHEQFLEAYEKPTQIYRFLHARHTLKPLFMHRNLAYMQHRNSHRRKKRTNKIRVNDFLKYRKEREPEGKDLASQIKSDNFLKITFHDLQKGVDFSHLLSAALSGDVRQAPPTCHAPSLMELEVLLYQHTSEAASCSCSSVSLGKFEVEYTPSKNAKIVGCRDSNHSLMIPESKLVWNGKNRGIGSLMLVFRARASTGQKSHPHQKKSLQPSLAKVSVELNRMNHSDIAQLTKTKHTLQIASQANTATSEGSARVPKYTQSATDFDSQQAAVFSNAMNGSSSNVEAYDSNLEKGNESSTVSSNLEVPRNTTAKVKEKRDACIMTDLSLGTGETTSPSHEHNARNGPLEHDLGVSRNDRSCSESPFFPKKGFTEDGASLLTKLASQRNGFLNGLNLFNGLTDDHQSQKINDNSISHNEEDAAFPDSNESDYSLTVSIPCTYHNGSQASSTSSLFIESSNHRKGYKIPARKRSEIQLLLDGDKPPGQRISPEEIPVFTAEDPSNRATRYMALQSKGCWTQLGTGTRKITPVEPFTYSASSTLIPNKLSGIKRSLSESDAPLSSDISSPPPKMARVSETDEQPGESMDEILEEQNSDIRPMRAFSKSVSPPPSPMPPPPPSPPPNFENELDEKIHDSLEQAPQSIAPEGLFCAEMVVFDSRGECLLDKGEYSILMQKCSQKEAGSEPPPLVTFSPLSWSSVFGGGEQNEAEQSESIMLKFSLSWSQGPPKHRLHTELETALDLQRIRNDYFPPTPRPPITDPSSGNTACTTTASGSVPSPPHQPDHSEQSNPTTNPPANPLTSNSSPGVVSNQQEYACNGEETEDREDDLEEMTLENETEQKEKSPQLKDIPSTNQDNGAKESKDDQHVEEYFTATEASASSVADSTELTQCRPPSIPLFAPSFEKAGRIIYNFLYHNNSLQQTESRGDMRCPWCSLLCGNLYSLLKHMSLCHPRFLFTYTPMEGGSIIDVHVNKLYEAGQTSMDRDPVERSGMNLRQRWKVPLKCLPCTAIIVERHEAVVEDLSEFLNDGSWKRGYNVKRQYYHSHTCLPMVPEEIDQDSEVELESIGRWQKICSQKMIDEFTDVNGGEKEMMKMWNVFAMKQGMTAYKQIPGACLQFTQENGSEIIQKKIVYSFLAHLIGLSDFGLITPSVIKSCMDTLHALQAS